MFFPLDDEFGRNYNWIPPTSKGSNKSESEHLAVDVSVGKGCMILVRPDQCINWVGRLDGIVALEELYGRIFLLKKHASIELCVTIEPDCGP